MSYYLVDVPAKMGILIDGDRYGTGAMADADAGGRCACYG